MVAMKNATDSAKSMIEELTIYYNKARQSGITQEIAEISSATEALTNAG
jgi:F-type H+-transporting ATPase subunit gamma